MAPETTEHYICSCLTFGTQREKLLSSLSNILGDEIYSYNAYRLTRLLLYGSEEISVELNIGIIEIFHTFIEQTKRFSYEYGIY